MATSETQICNIALGRIGVSKIITSLDELNNNEARMCRVFYESCRDRLLAEFNWPFATRRANLQTITYAAQPEQWAYAYRYPADCISARRLDTGDDYNNEPFIVVEDAANDSLAILCNVESAVLVYTARITLAGLFSPLFANALSWLIASEIAIPLSAQASLGTAAGQQYRNAVNEAYAMAMNGQRETDRPTVEFLSVRD